MTASHRGVQAVEVEPVEADLRSPCPARVVVRAQPADEVEHVGVAPHPGREALEAAQRLARPSSSSPRAADVAVDPVGVGPVGLDGDGGEALLLRSAAA